MLRNDGAPVQACVIARSPKVERARASCSVGLKKLFCVYGVLPCGSVVQGHNKLATSMGSAAI